MDRVSADAALALLEYETIFERAPVGIVFTRPGKLTRCNPRMAEMFGYACAELDDSDAGILFPSPQHYADFRDESLPAPRHRFLATGDPEPFGRLGQRFLGPEVGDVARAERSPQLLGSRAAS